MGTWSGDTQALSVITKAIPDEETSKKWWWEATAEVSMTSL